MLNLSLAPWLPKQLLTASTCTDSIAAIDATGLYPSLPKSPHIHPFGEIQCQEVQAELGTVVDKMFPMWQCCGEGRTLLEEGNPF